MKELIPDPMSSCFRGLVSSWISTACRLDLSDRNLALRCASHLAHSTDSLRNRRERKACSRQYLYAFALYVVCVCVCVCGEPGLWASAGTPSHMAPEVFERPGQRRCEHEVN